MRTAHELAMDEAKRLAHAATATGQSPAAAVGWFDSLYAGAAGDPQAVPWAHLEPSRYYAAWADKFLPSGCGRSALVVGCGLGDDAEDLAGRGFETTAFDVSPAAVAWCGRRFPNSAVRYRAADLLDHPPAWHRGFDFVLEVYTLQALPADLRARAVRHIADCLAPGGTLLVISRGRDADDHPGDLPWPLTKAEVHAFAKHGLAEAGFEDFLSDGEPPTRLFRAAFTKG